VHRDEACRDDLDPASRRHGVERGASVWRLRVSCPISGAATKYDHRLVVERRVAIGFAGREDDVDGADQFVSWGAWWAALCPGNNESAGKRKTGKVRCGNPICTMLCEADDQAFALGSEYIGRRDEGITSPGEGRDVSSAVLSIAERPAQVSDVEPQTAFFYGDVPFANDLVGASHQSN
jgi:hypothetical protein